MASFCCRSERSKSPGLPNARLVKPVHEVDATDQKRDEQVLKAIFTQTSSPRKHSGSGVDAMKANDISRRSSTIGLHEITTKIRKRLSRDSETSKNSSRKARSTTSDKDMERRRELKRALHRRLQEELVADRSVEEDSYDSDAESLITPTFENIRLEAENYAEHAANDQLGHVGNPSGSSNTSDEVLLPRSGSPIKAGKILGIKILDCSPQRALKASSDPEVSKAQASVSTGPHKVKTRKTSKQTGSETAVLSRSSTLKHRGPVSVPNKRYSSLPRPKAPGYALSSTPSTRRVQSAQFLEDLKQRDELKAYPSSAAKGSDCVNEIRKLPSEDATYRFTDTESKQIGELSTDGKLRNENSLPSNVTLGDPKITDCPLEQPSEQMRSEPSIHLFDMRISQRLASRSLMPSHSLPHLTDTDKTRHRHDRQSSGSNSSKYSTDARRRRRTPSSGLNSTKLPTSWGNVVRDGTSSIYQSHGNSLPTSSSSSVNHIGYIINGTQLQDSKINASGMARDLFPLDDVHDTSAALLLSSPVTDFTNDIEKLACSKVRTEPRREYDGETNTSADQLLSNGRRSLEPPKDDRVYYMRSIGFDDIGALVSYDGTTEKGNPGLKLDLKSLRVPEPPHSWRGSTYGTSPKSTDEDAAVAWERAMSNHVSREAERSMRRTSTYSPQISITDCSMTQDRSNQASVHEEILGEPSVTNEGVTHFNPINYGRKSLKPKPSSHTDSWSRFPSHTRHERTSSAGQSDQVIPRDFAKEVGAPLGVTNATTQKSGLMGKRKTKSRSMTFGKGIFKNWGRLYKSQSVDFRRYEAGHRSSIASGGILEYPELEVLPPILPASGLRISELDSALDVSKDETTEPQTDGAFAEIGGTKLRDETPTSARVWSQLYESCVNLPSETESLVSAKGRSTVREAAQTSNDRMLGHVGDLNEDPGVDMRRPTRDFEELLRAGEVTERYNLLKAAERAWGG